MRGKTYPISLSQIYSGSSYAVCFKVFVDWNHNGIFDAATETAFSAGPSSIAPVTGNLIVPSSAITGTTHFRVVMVESSSTANVYPCGTYTWGETEDYYSFVYCQWNINSHLF